MSKKLSSGFAGANTASIRERNEKQLKRLDVFREDFSPPGTGDSSPPIDKKDRPFGARPTLTDSSDSTSDIDLITHELECRIKGYDQQFPGAKMSADKDGPSDNAAFDKHLTDPRRLMGPDSFDKEVEKKMKRLISIEERVLQDYAALKSMSMQALKVEFQRHHRVSSVDGEDKMTLVMGILEARHGANAIERAFSKKKLSEGDDILAIHKLNWVKVGVRVRNKTNPLINKGAVGKVTAIDNHGRTTVEFEVDDLPPKVAQQRGNGVFIIHPGNIGSMLDKA